MAVLVSPISWVQANALRTGSGGQQSKMGEARRKSRSSDEIIASEIRCIYCANPAQSVEHMPPRGMFRDRQRPSAMEFGVCYSCNAGTRGSDAVAALMARLHPDNGVGTWQAKDIQGLRSAIDRYAPGVREEMSTPGKFRYELAARARSGLLQKVVRVHADGPLVKAHLSIFGAKLGMALYREHIGVALPYHGAVWTQFALSAGMSQEHLDARVERLPLFETLRQGRKHVADQFMYRFNCDERTVIAAVAQFHRGLWFTLVASSDQKIIELFSRPESLKLPASALVRPGELLKLVPNVPALRFTKT